MSANLVILIIFIFTVSYISGVIAGIFLISLKHIPKEPRKMQYSTKKKVTHNFSSPLKPFKDFDDKYKNKENLFEPVRPHSGVEIKE